MRGTTAADRRRSGRAAALLALLACSGAGCGAEERPTWARLAELHEPAGPAGEGGAARWERFDVALAAFAPDPSLAEGVLAAPAPWAGLGLPVVLDDPARPPRAALGATALVRDVALGRQASPRGVPGEVGAAASVGRFDLASGPTGARILLAPPSGAGPGPSLSIEVPVSEGARAPGGAWRVAVGPWASDGFPLRAGAAVETTLDVAPGSRLRFAASAIPSGAAAIEVAWRTESAAGRREIPFAGAGRLAWEEVEIDLDGARGATTVAFRAEGPLRWAAIHAPVVGPGAVGRAGERPWSEARPDVVLFLADTLRADALSLHGAEVVVAPRLEAFARESLCFRRAWAPACWTLPSQTSLFLALEPHRHGAVRYGLARPAGIVSLAERFRAAGYRTAAVTDSLLVSRVFGFDRGFERFEERDVRDIDATVDRALELAALDDGRPLFLFVHTYRAHMPYEASEETRRALGAELGLEDRDTIETFLRELVERATAAAPELQRTARARFEERDFVGVLATLGMTVDDAGPDGRSYAERLRALYYGGVADLDRGFGRFLDGLDAGGIGRRAVVVFTSDHGEALGEHGTLFHAQGVWEENLRIPLLVRSPRLAPRVSELGASLVDLPRTLCELAGIAPAPGWGGRSLASAVRDEPVLAFDCEVRGAGGTAAVVAPDDLKVAFPDEDGDPVALRAFDLVRDPGERCDLLPGAGARARAALDAARAAIERARTPVAAAPHVEVPPDLARRIGAVGYAGD